MLIESECAFEAGSKAMGKQSENQQRSKGQIVPSYALLFTAKSHHYTTELHSRNSSHAIKCFTHVSNPGQSLCNCHNIIDRMRYEESLTTLTFIGDRVSEWNQYSKVDRFTWCDKWTAFDWLSIGIRSAWKVNVDQGWRGNERKREQQQRNAQFWTQIRWTWWE